MDALSASSADSAHDLLLSTETGLSCPSGGFWVDPRRPVPLAVITHAHGDHVRGGCGRYIASESCVPLLRRRLPRHADILGVPFGRVLRLGRTAVSLHPAGHVLGSAQVRVERDEGDAGGATGSGEGGADRVWVVSGDYKRAPDPSCEPFEPVRCGTFVTEATFARPRFRWPADPFEPVRAWWAANRERGRTSILFVYALGKAQRVLAGLGAPLPGPVLVHPEIAAVNAAYAEAGRPLPLAGILPRKLRGRSLAGALVLAPPRYRQASWTRRFGDASLAAATGWAAGDGTGGLPALAAGADLERRFVLSDHADWPGILRTIEEIGARRVLVTHGEPGELVAALRARGVEAAALDEVAPR